MTRRAVSSEKAPAALGPYSQAIVANGLIFCSGMAGIDPAGAIPEGIEAQTEQALTNLAGVLEAAGASMDDVVKTTIFYADVEDFGRLNEVYARHMPDPPPARSAPAHVRLPAVYSSRSRQSRSFRPERITLADPRDCGNSDSRAGRSSGFEFPAPTSSMRQRDAWLQQHRHAPTVHHPMRNARDRDLVGTRAADIDAVSVVGELHSPSQRRRASSNRSA